VADLVERQPGRPLERGVAHEEANAAVGARARRGARRRAPARRAPR
jgi:hypothetical protein